MLDVEEGMMGVWLSGAQAPTLFLGQDEAHMAKKTVFFRG